MKKPFIILLVLIILLLSVAAAEVPIEENGKSISFIDIINSSDILYSIEAFRDNSNYEYTLHTRKYKLYLDVYKLTKIENNDVYFGISFTMYSNDDTTYKALKYIDFEELDTLIKSITYMKKVIEKGKTETLPPMYELFFNSKDGIKFSASVGIIIYMDETHKYVISDIDIIDGIINYLEMVRDNIEKII